MFRNKKEEALPQKASAAKKAPQKGKKTEKKEKGAKGEAQAKALLQKAGCTILAANYRCRQAEIDLIAKDGEEVVFVEVKYRSSVALGRGAEAVDWRKQQKIKQGALCFLQQEGLLDTFVRFDVIEVYPDRTEWIKHAFWEQ